MMTIPNAYMEITIYASCSCKSKALDAMVKSALGQRKAKITTVTDPMKLAADGITMPPALAVNGELLFHGRMPTAGELSKAISRYD